MDSTERHGLALPPSAVSQPSIGQHAVAPHFGQIGLNLGIPAFSLFDDAVDGCLIKYLTDGHRRLRPDNLKQGLPSALHLNFGRAAAFYPASLINGGAHDVSPKSSGTSRSARGN